MSIQSEIERIRANVAVAYTAVTGKGGTVPTAKVSANLASAIGTIPVGTDTSDATAAAGDILSGKTAYVKGAKVTGNIASKGAADLTSSGVAVSVPAGYYPAAVSKSVATATQATPGITVSSAGLITASATQTAGYVEAGTKSATKQLTTQAASTITPGTAAKTAVASGRYTTGAVTVKGDANLVAGNIKSGVSIFGVAGSYAGTGSSGSVTLGTVTFSISGVTNYTVKAWNGTADSPDDLIKTLLSVPVNAVIAIVEMTGTNAAVSGLTVNVKNGVILSDAISVYNASLKTYLRKVVVGIKFAAAAVVTVKSSTSGGGTIA